MKASRSEAMQSENLIKCLHTPCRCLVELEDQFCSTACGSAKEAPLGPACSCGHPECVGIEQATEEDE